MAVQNAIISYTVLDADGDQASVPIYASYDDATMTLASMTTWVQQVAGYLDAVIDCQVTKINVQLAVNLPAGLKPAPIAGCDVERTGLITYNLTTPAGKAYGQDIPGWATDEFEGDNIKLGSLDVLQWTGRMTGAVAPFTAKNDLWSTTLASVRKGVKSTRKLGR